MVRRDTAILKVAQDAGIGEQLRRHAEFVGRFREEVLLVFWVFLILLKSLSWIKTSRVNSVSGVSKLIFGMLVTRATFGLLATASWCESLRSQ